MELPLPTNVPPQLPEYQFQAAAVPNEPPDKLSVVVDALAHTGFGLALALVGGVDSVNNPNDIQVYALFPHKFWAITQTLPAEPGVAVMTFVPAPELTTQPAGNVQL